MAPNFAQKYIHNLSMCFWNVGGLKSKTFDKTQDPIFTKCISQYDIVILAESHLGYGDC